MVEMITQAKSSDLFDLLQGDSLLLLRRMEEASREGVENSFLLVKPRTNHERETKAGFVFPVVTLEQSNLLRAKVVEAGAPLLGRRFGRQRHSADQVWMRSDQLELLPRQGLIYHIAQASQERLSRGMGMMLGRTLYDPPGIFENVGERLDQFLTTYAAEI